MCGGGDDESGRGVCQNNKANDRQDRTVRVVIEHGDSSSSSKVQYSYSALALSCDLST